MAVGIHAARPGTRFEALRQGLRAHHGGYGPGVAAGLSLRHDHGSQYLSDHFQGELRFLGIRSSPSFGVCQISDNQRSAVGVLISAGWLGRRELPDQRTPAREEEGSVRSQGTPASASLIDGTVRGR